MKYRCGVCAKRVRTTTRIINGEEARRPIRHNRPDTGRNCPGWCEPPEETDE